jgi:hypothetical protein
MFGNLHASSRQEPILWARKSFASESESPARIALLRRQKYICRDVAAPFLHVIGINWRGLSASENFRN